MSFLIDRDDAQTLQVEIDDRAENLFEAKTGKTPLQVSRVFKKTIEGIDEKRVHGACYVRNQNVWDGGQLKGVQNADDACQVFIIRQRGSWTTLDISRDIFETFLRIFGICDCIWRCVFTFGRKRVENEFQFPGFSRRRSRILDSEDYVHESAYMLRRVELNGRGEDEEPWSIRQTAIYHKLLPHHASSASCDKDYHSRPTSKFLLISPSKNAERRINEYFEQRVTSGSAVVSPWNLHRILVADSLKGWMDYMASLEARLKKVTRRVALANVGQNDDPSPLIDISANFDDRQDLRILEDKIIDLQIILPTLLGSVSGIRDQCKIGYESTISTEEDKAERDIILDEFDEYVNTIHMNIDRTKILKEKAMCTTQLLSDLLSYEEAEVMKILAIESQKEGKSMRYLAERSTKDAAAMKILTVITLVYLPTTIVANFFSTQFIQTNAAGHMTLATNFWLLFAIAIPLTALTILLWWIWLRCIKVPTDSEPITPGVSRRNTFRSLRSRVSFKPFKDSRSGDIDVEKAFSCLQTPAPPPPARPHSPPPFQDSSPTQTWSSTAPTEKQ